MAIKLCLTLSLLALASSDCVPQCLSSLLGNGDCDGPCNNFLCNFDGGDCIKDCQCDPSKLNDGMCDSDCNNFDCSWDYGDCNQSTDQDESLLEDYGEISYQDLDEDLPIDEDQIPSDLQDLDDEIGEYNEMQDEDEYYDNGYGRDEREDDEDDDGMSSKKRSMIIALSVSIPLATIILAVVIICRIRRNKKRREAGRMEFNQSPGGLEMMPSGAQTPEIVVPYANDEKVVYSPIAPAAQPEVVMGQPASRGSTVVGVPLSSQDYVTPGYSSLQYGANPNQEANPSDVSGMSHSTDMGAYKAAQKSSSKY